MRLSNHCLGLVILSGCSPSGNAPDLRVGPDEAGITAPRECPFSAESNRRTLPALCLDGGGRLRDRVVFVNDTGQVVEIKDVGRSCICTAPHISRGTIPPGERTEIGVEASLSRTSGPWHYTLAVNLKDGRTRTVTTSTYLYRTLEPEKDALYLMDLKAGQAHHPTFQMFAYRRADEPARALEVRSAEDRMTVRHRGPTTTTIHGVIRGAYEIELTLTPDASGAGSEDTLIATLGGEGPASTARVHVFWRAATPFAVTPDRAFFLLPPKATKPISQVLVVRSAVGEFTPAAVESDLPPGLSVAFRPTSNPAQWLADVTVDPARLALDSRRLELRIATGRRDQPTFHLPVTLFRE